MKRIALVILFAALPAFAQQQAPSAQEIQQMLNQAQKNGRISINSEMIMAAMGMHQCMQEKVGEAGMKRLAESGKAFHEQIKPLCAAGKRNEAMQLQMSYAKTTMKSPEYAGVKACADQYKDAFKGPQFKEIRAIIEQPDQTERHVCDYQK